MDHCKRTGSYLIGNISLSNITLACADLTNSNLRWVGVVKDQYVKADKGNGKVQAVCYYIIDNKNLYFLKKVCIKIKCTLLQK